LKSRYRYQVFLKGEQTNYQPFFFNFLITAKNEIQGFSSSLTIDSFVFLGQAVRRERKEAANQEKGRVNEKLLYNLMKSHALGDLTGEETRAVPAKPGREPDMFLLPPLPDVDKG
jgi:hypothetical protein